MSPAQALKPVDTSYVAARSSTVRVDFTQLDHLLNLVGELIIFRTKLDEVGRDLAGRLGGREEARDLVAAVQQVAGVSAQLQETVMDIRMLPIRHVFERFPRLVRDLARQQGKRVELILEGEATRVDKAIIDEIGEPLAAHDPQQPRPRHRDAGGARGPRQDADRHHPALGRAGVEPRPHHHHGRRRRHRRAGGPPQGDRARHPQERRQPQRARARAADLLPGLLDGGTGRRAVRPRRRPRRGPEVDRAPERPGRGGDGAGRRLEVHHRAAAHPRHHRSAARRVGRPHVRDPARSRDREPEAHRAGHPLDQRARDPAPARPHHPADPSRGLLRAAQGRRRPSGSTR